MSASLHRPESRPVSDATQPGRVALAAALLIGCGLVAYHNSFAVPFLFDDLPAIVANPALDTLWGSGTAAEAGGLTTSGRPVVQFSLALNRALSGNAVAAYHATNLLIHLGAGLGVFGLMRRTLQAPLLRERFGAAALPLAWVTAALWLLHPLQTESVTYVVQRAEALAGLFVVLTLYAFARGGPAARAGLWFAVATGSCLLGFASKEVAVSIPLLVLLYDRTFVSGTFHAAWRRHRRLYLLLALAWVLLAGLVLGTGSRGGTAGFGAGVSVWNYALTQCRALGIYLGQAAWPDALVFDYGVGVVQRVTDVLPHALGVVVLVVAVGAALRHRPAAGFAGVWFLALLAPSSSVIPIATQTMAEHRMYLPLAAIIAVAVVLLYRILGHRAVTVAGVAAVALTLATVARNRDYRSEESIWRDTTVKWPVNARAHNNLGQALDREGKTAAAIACYERAIQIQPTYPEPHYNLGVALARLDQLPAAIERFESALRLQPRYPEAHNNLGNALVRSGRLPEAMTHYEQAIAIRPGFAEAHHNLGHALLRAGRSAEALPRFRRALELKPDYAEARYNLGNALADTGAMAGALEQYRLALKLQPAYAEARVNAGNALLALGRPAEAVVEYEQAVALAPTLVDAHFNLGSALLELGRWTAAIPPLESVVRLDPRFVRAHRALGFALGQTGRATEAIAHYEIYLRAVPDDREARDELNEVRARPR